MDRAHHQHDGNQWAQSRLEAHTSMAVTFLTSTLAHCCHPLAVISLSPFGRKIVLPGCVFDVGDMRFEWAPPSHEKVATKPSVRGGTMPT